MREVQALRAEFDKLGVRLAALEAEQPCRIIDLPPRSIRLRDGEEWAGTVLNEDGTYSHELILIPGEAVEVTWDNAVAWAKEQGGDLPDRREQALLYANLKGKFQEAWYWSNAPHASGRHFAWGQSFGYGGQDSYFKSRELRARAVRRLVIQ